MNNQYIFVNPLYNPEIIGGNPTDIFYVLTRNTEVRASFGEHQKNYIFIDEIPNQDVLKNGEYDIYLTDFRGIGYKKIANNLYECLDILSKGYKITEEDLHFTINPSYRQLNEL